MSIKSDRGRIKGLINSENTRVKEPRKQTNLNKWVGKLQQNRYEYALKERKRKEELQK